MRLRLVLGYRRFGPTCKGQADEEEYRDGWMLEHTGDGVSGDVVTFVSHICQ